MKPQYYKTLFFRAIALTATAVLCLNAVVSCDKMPGNGQFEYLEDDYIPVTEVSGDMDGDYIIAHLKSLTEAEAFCTLDGTAGKPGKTLEIHEGGEIWGSSADGMKAVLKKADEYSYTLRITGIGHIGYDGNGGFTSSTAENTENAYLWDVLESANGGVRLCPKTAGEGMSIAWNGESFTVSEEGTPAVLFKRMTATGISDTPKPGPDPDPKPDPDPTPDPDPKPDPDPTPDPEPDPEPGPSVPTNAKYGWFELPAVDYEESGKYIIGKSDKSLYFAHHFCAGGEKGPGGKTARNYTVCYSAEEHCPVWVAAPRHSMYSGSVKRTNAYGKDPSIPSDIQYHSERTGGGCNKGHMLGSNERRSTSATNRQVFYYTNIAPQLSGTFNTGGGAWNNLEDHIDGLVCKDTLYEVVGCYFKQFRDAYGEICDPQKISFGGRSDVTRPSMFYYVLLRTKKGNTGKAVSKCSSSELQCVAFVIRHDMEKGHRPQAKDMMSVSDLEKLTGFSYFPNVPNAPKNTFTPSDWL